MGEIKYLNYTWNNFDDDVEHISEILNSMTNIDDREFYFVGIFRGGLPLAVKLSNRFDSRMGIIQYQSYGEGADKKLSFHIFSPKANDIIVIVDDIVDTGKTLDIVNKALLEKGIVDVIYVSLFKHQNYQGLDHKIKLYSCREKLNEWVVYSWE